jgi:hypothetical protein
MSLSLAERLQRIQNVYDKNPDVEGREDFNQLNDSEMLLEPEYYLNNNQLENIRIFLRSISWDDYDEIKEILPEAVHINKSHGGKKKKKKVKKTKKVKKMKKRKSTRKY